MCVCFLFDYNTGLTLQLTVMVVGWFEAKSSTAQVLEFFNVATVDELTMMNGCSRKKAEAVIKMRPFDDWEALV